MATIPPTRRRLDRRKVIAGLSAGAALAAFPQAATAQSLGGVLGLGNILGGATDTALDKLAEPNAFYNDEDIRIGLPMIGSGSGGGLLGSIVGGARDLGILDGLIRKLNDAAGVAAGEAKPIFRDAINDLSFSDAPGIIREKDGATRYLRRSSEETLFGKLSPLVDSALSSLGAYDTLDRLSGENRWLARVGISRDGLNETVTHQGLDGIFSYIGAEERKVRDNPVDSAGGVLRGLLGN